MPINLPVGPFYFLRHRHYYWSIELGLPTCPQHLQRLRFLRISKHSLFLNSYRQIWWPAAYKEWWKEPEFRGYWPSTRCRSQRTDWGCGGGDNCTAFLGTRHPALERFPNSHHFAWMVWRFRCCRCWIGICTFAFTCPLPKASSCYILSYLDSDAVGGAALYVVRRGVGTHREELRKIHTERTDDY